MSLVQARVIAEFNNIARDAGAKKMHSSLLSGEAKSSHITLHSAKTKSWISVNALELKQNIQKRQQEVLLLL